MIAPYADPRYAAALAAGGGLQPVLIAAWHGAAVLRRPVPGADAQDIAGPYPLMPFAPGWDIAAGLEEMRRDGAVSAVFVSDPVLACADPARFDHARPFKRHHIVRDGYAPGTHHRAELRRAARRCDVAEIPFADALADWVRLYGGLVAAKNLAGGPQDFGACYARALLPLAPRAFAARTVQGVVGMSLWLRHGALAWYHLAATDAAGRAAGAGYPLVDVAVRTLLAEGVSCVVLGGGLADARTPACGLERFKAGFANDVRTNLLLGAVLDPARYAAFGGAEGWFPAYRAPAPRGVLAV
ncbi:GNAT family N-acetyltransferase [Falsiroseomonas oryzae]|uniref:GNAT family N-acetyltransferase n=1 Tax=Falsiroseomonas oryzae TaxID=2766473 RepID=UPI0022EABCA9|nr:GNAT family N-acetyltransferase [Roseomonas sp. MO-31]